MVNLQHILMHKISLITGIVVMSLSASAAHARYVTTTCDGKVGWHPLSAYTAIIKDHGTAEVKNDCVFVTRSRIGRKILKVCPEDSQCSVEADIQTGIDEYEITSVRAINRIGTPSLDAIAAREKAAREKRRWASVFPYMEKAKNCVVDNLKGEVSASSISDILFDGICSQQGKALRSEFSRQFSHSGHYKFMDYYHDLAEIVSKLRTYPK
jgi:hypothetical protein